MTFNDFDIIDRIATDRRITNKFKIANIKISPDAKQQQKQMMYYKIQKHCREQKPEEIKELNRTMELHKGQKIDTKA